MAKGLRSKIKRHFRSVKRETVGQKSWQVEGEKRQQEMLQKILAAPRPSELAKAEAEAAEGGMAVEGDTAAEAAAGPSGMAVDGAEGQQEEGAMPNNPAKLLKKLRKQRLLKTKGIAKGHKKRAKPLAGANQFHKKAKGKKRR